MENESLSLNIERAMAWRHLPATDVIFASLPDDTLVHLYDSTEFEGEEVIRDAEDLAIGHGIPVYTFDYHTDTGTYFEPASVRDMWSTPIPIPQA